MGGKLVILLFSVYKSVVNQRCESICLLLLSMSTHAKIEVELLVVQYSVMYVL